MSASYWQVVDKKLHAATLAYLSRSKVDGLAAQLMPSYTTLARKAHSRDHRASRLEPRRERPSLGHLFALQPFNRRVSWPSARAPRSPTPPPASRAHLIEQNREPDTNREHPVEHNQQRRRSKVLAVWAVGVLLHDRCKVMPDVSDPTLLRPASTARPTRAHLLARPRTSSRSRSDPLHGG